MVKLTDFTAEEIAEAKSFIAHAWLSFSKRKPQNIESWLEENIILGESEARPGLYSIARTEPVREVYRSYANPKVKQIYVMIATQMFKTQSLLGMMLYSIKEDPGNGIFVMPTQKLLKPFIRGRFEAACKENNLFADLVGSMKVSEKIGGKQTLDVKYFLEGMLVFLTAESHGGVSMLPAGKVWMDEVDKYKSHNAVDEAMSRGKNFPESKLVAVSSPEERDKSIIADLWETGNKQRYHYRCPKCKNYILPSWDDVVWDLTGTVLISESVRYRCPNCGDAWDDKKRDAAIVTGHWVAERPEIKDIHSYNCSSLVSQLAPLEDMVSRYLISKEKEGMGELSAIKRFYKDDLASPWGDGKGHLDARKVQEELCLRAWTENDIPNDVLAITCSVDVQSDRFEIEWAGWGKGNRRWGLQFRKLVLEPEKKSSWRGLGKLLEKHRFFTRQDKIKLECRTTFIDSGGTYTQECYRFTRWRGDKGMSNPKNKRGWFPIKGKGGEGEQIITAKWLEDLGNHFIMLGVNDVKGFIIDSINHSIKDGNQTWQWNSHPDAQYTSTKARTSAYFQSLCAERREVEKRKTKYVLRRQHQPNEGFDLAVYNYAALVMRAGNSMVVDDYLDKWENRIESRKAAMAEVEAEAAKAKKSSSARQ